MMRDYAEYSTLVLRIFFGIAFIIAGLDKVLSFSMAKGMFEGMFGAGLGGFMIILAIIIELLCGLALLLGLYTRIAAGILALMIVVAFIVTFKLGQAPHFVGILREISVMNTGGGNTAVNFAYFAALLSLVFSGSKVAALKPDSEF
ncbi:MAG: DoxX family membrane protein [Nanoarchaeota archaeon]